MTDAHRSLDVLLLSPPILFMGGAFCSEFAAFEAAARNRGGENSSDSHVRLARIIIAEGKKYEYSG